MSRAKRDNATAIPMFVHSKVDDLPLDVYAMRAYMAICRRAGDADGEYWESVVALAERTGMSAPRARQALRDLEASNLIVGTPRTGQTTVYRVTPTDALPTPAPRKTTARPDAPQAKPPSASDGDDVDTQDMATPTPRIGVEDDVTGGTPTPHIGVPRHHVSGTPTPGVAKGTPVSSSKEGTPTLSSETASEAGAEPSRARHSPGREGANHPKRDRESKAKGKGRQAKGKGSRKGENLATPDADLTPFVAAWNEHRGLLPAVEPDPADLTRAEAKRLQAFASKHSDALERFTAAVRHVAADEYWVRKAFGLETLLRGDRLTEMVRKGRHTNGLSEGDRVTTAKAMRIYAAIDGTFGATFADKEYPDVTADELLGLKPFPRGATAYHTQHGTVRVIGESGAERIIETQDGETDRVHTLDLQHPPRVAADDQRVTVLEPDDDPPAAPRVRALPTGPLPAAVTEYMRRPNGATPTPDAELVEPDPIADPPQAKQPPPKPKPTPEQRARAQVETAERLITELDAEGKHDHADMLRKELAKLQRKANGTPS